MDCGRCGAYLESPHLDGMFQMDEEIICPECQTVNQIGVEGQDSDPEENTAYVSHWMCKHGVSDDDPCAECDAEDEAAGTVG